jgi:hypothetical protein
VDGRKVEHRKKERPEVKVDFDPATHTYRAGGVKFPSVTGIISDIGLYGDTSYFDDYCRERGSFIHRIIQYHLAGELDEATIDPALQGYFDAWQRFEKEVDFVSDECERVMASDIHRFAGTLDHVGHLNGHYCVIDTKTGVMTPQTALQLSGYEILLGHPGVKRFGLQLMNKGKYKLTEFKDRGDRQMFMAALAVWYWKRNNNIGR